MNPTHRKPMLTWIIPTALILLAAAAAFAIHRLNAAKTALANAITAGNGAVAAYTIDEDGSFVEDGRAVFINDGAPLVTGSVMKVVVLAAYEQAVEQGVLDPAEPVTLSDLERFYLPGADGGAHAAALAALGLRADSLGFAADPQTTVSLDTIATWMIHYSGNAETDYLITRLTSTDPLAPDRLAVVIQAAGMQHTAPIRPILGVSLAMLNHEQSPVTPQLCQAFLRDAAAGDFSALDALADRYRSDPAWRAAQIAWMQSDAFTAAVNQIGWEGQVECSRLFPTASARDYAALMARIATDTLFSPAAGSDRPACARMRQKLESIPTDGPLRLLFHRTYGAKDGLTAGVLALASYAVPKRGPLAGQTRVVVILANDLTPQVWSSAVQSQSIYLLQADLAAAARFVPR